MRKKIFICVLLLVTSKCDSHEHRPTVLGGLLSGAHELGTKVQNVLGGLAQGALNLGGHIEANRVQAGYQNQPPQHNGGYRPGNAPETIIVVVENNGPSQHHNHHGHPGHRPPHHGDGPPNNFNQPNYPNRPGYGYNPPNNGPWNDNNYNKPQNPRPGYGYNPHGQSNYNGNPYTNNGNFNQNNYGRPNDGNVNQNYGTKPPASNNGDLNQNNYGPPSPNNGNYNQNNFNTKPTTENFGQNSGAQTPTFNSGSSNQNPFGNIPNSPPPPFERPPGGYQDQNKPSPDLTTKPENRPQYGSVFDVNKENANNIPTRKPDTNVNSNEHTTKKPVDDDTPLFIPLNPNQYQYGGDKVEVNAPKRETNPKPTEDDSESYPIDVRFGD